MDQKVVSKDSHCAVKKVSVSETYENDVVKLNWNFTHSIYIWCNDDDNKHKTHIIILMSWTTNLSHCHFNLTSFSFSYRTEIYFYTFMRFSNRFIFAVIESIFILLFFKFLIDDIFMHILIDDNFSLRFIHHHDVIGMRTTRKYLIKIRMKMYFQLSYKKPQQSSEFLDFWC